MNAASVRPEQPPASPMTLTGSIAFVIAVLVIAGLAGEPAGAVYALSFWHYGLYALAYALGAVSLPTFKRDAVLMKSVSLAALGWAYFAAPIDAVSITLVAAGFLLNMSAARALGADRTYYGYELGRVPPARITVFPYSLIGHPMLVGNILAFAATLLNEPFRAQWWPLALAHVALNVGLLFMELRVAPRCRAIDDSVRRSRGALLAAFGGAGAVSGAAVLLGSASPAAPVVGALFGGCAAAYASLLYLHYSTPVDPARPETAAKAQPK